MKKIFTLLTFVSLLSLAHAQQETSRGTVPGFSDRLPVYSNDVIIQNAPTIDQRRVRISVAFNGWLYAAFSTVDSAANAGGITIRMSRDNGQTWNPLDAYMPAGYRYPAHDIVVAGTDTNNLVLYMAGVNYNTATAAYILFVDRYDARTGAFLGSNFNRNNGTRTIYDVSLASDYMNPAVGASPYSVGMLYSTYSSSFDSINFVGSVDGGQSWTVNQHIARTGGYNRNVSLAYGKSNSASNGRYFAAWEQLGASNARVGHIFHSHCTSTVNGSWIPPVNLDSVSTTMINLCRNPQIAVQYNNIDNDSSSCTAVVLCQRDYTGNGSDYDLLGFYNKRSHFTNFWYRLDIVNSGENDLQPDISYDPGNNNFLAVYYDSTNGKLPYVVNNFNLTTPSSWTTINPQYNDVTTGLKAAYPRVEINPVVTQTAHAWIAESGTKGVAMFDAEYVFTGINSHGQGGIAIDQLYPNPAAETVNLVLSGNTDEFTITVTDLLGKIIHRQTMNSNHVQLDVSGWNAGAYFCKIESGNKNMTRRFVVAH